MRVDREGVPLFIQDIGFYGGGESPGVYYHHFRVRFFNGKTRYFRASDLFPHYTMKQLRSEECQAYDVPRAIEKIARARWKIWQRVEENTSE